MTRNERRKKAIEQEMQRHSGEIKSIWKKADEDDRESSPDERKDVESKLKAIELLKDELSEVEANIKVEQDVNAVSQSLGKAESSVSDARVVNEPPPWAAANGYGGFYPMVEKAIGDKFVESKAFQDIHDSWKSGNRVEFSTGAVSMDTKGTLLEGTGAAPGTGGAIAAAVPQVVPGVMEKLFQPLTVSDLIASGTTSSNTLRYIVEGTATSGATGVAEAAAKPESTLALSTVDEPVKKIATSLTVSDEMIEDAPALQSYINGRLSLFVRIEEERQLLLGAAGNDLSGLTLRSGVNTYSGGTAAGNKAVQIFKAMNGTRGSALLEPDGIIMNPADWETVRLLTDSAGQFFGGGPFQGPYGNGQNISASGQLNGAMDILWNKPVVVTTAIGAGTAFVGAFRSAAQVFRRSGVSVEASNSHSDYFEKNLVKIRAEQRLALAVYRPVAFTKVVLA